MEIQILWEWCWGTFIWKSLKKPSRSPSDLNLSFRLTPVIFGSWVWSDLYALSYLRPALDVVGVFCLPAPCIRIWSSWNHLTSFSKISWVELCKDSAWTLSQGDTLVRNSVPRLEDSRGIFKVISPVTSGGIQVNPLRLRINIWVSWTWSPGLIISSGQLWPGVWTWHIH